MKKHHYLDAGEVMGPPRPTAAESAKMASSSSTFATGLGAVMSALTSGAKAYVEIKKEYEKGPAPDNSRTRNNSTYSYSNSSNILPIAAAGLGLILLIAVLKR